MRCRSKKSLPSRCSAFLGNLKARDARQTFALVAANYFDLLRIRVTKGRQFEPTDGRSSPPVVVVREALARGTWGSDNPVGKRIALPGGEAEVVGVAGDVRTRGLDAEAGRTVYIPTTQGTYNFMTVLVKTKKDPSTVAPTIRRLVHDLDPALPLHHVRTMSAIVAGSIAQQRFQMLLVTAFSFLMFALAVIGAYGVTAYGVSERTNELGIRAALGASSDDVRPLVLGEGARLAVIGILIGGVGAVALSRVMTRFVFQISTLDAVTFLVVPTVLASAMLLATFIPAHRAARVDPMQALRSE